MLSNIYATDEPFHTIFRQFVLELYKSMLKKFNNGILFKENPCERNLSNKA
jgi:hypothetical protein